MPQRRSTWPWIIALVVMPVLYVLSFGPGAWLMRHGLFPGGVLWFARFYAPLGRAIDGSPPFKSAMDWYVLLWPP